MASPQKENGYTAIANELVEAFARLRLSSNEWNVLHVILRMTYGWRCKDAVLTFQEIADAAGIDRSKAHRSLHGGKDKKGGQERAEGLVQKNIIITEKISAREVRYSLQKNYEDWIGYRSPVGERTKHC